MNDAQIRSNFHVKKLRRHHANPETLVVDELGLKHGLCRADIAVINGHLNGFEIKSDDDSLRRFAEQAETYNAVFDRATLIIAARHLKGAQRLTPSWWGVTVAKMGGRGAIHFEIVRPPSANPSTEDFAVAQLLWRSEAEEELAKREIHKRILRQPRPVLYRELVRILSPAELRRVIRMRMKSRTDWRCRARLSPGDDLSRPCAT